jgi:5'-nucleotidase
MENGLTPKNWTLNDGDLEDLVSRLRERSPVDPATDDARIYVNRSLSMNKIKAIGFDMDYTLIEYKSPEYETLAFDMAITRLQDVGYPKGIATIKYDASFPTRGLLFDKKYGNIIKVDGFGNILEVFHGFSCLTLAAIGERYPNKYAPASDPGYHILNTLFELPEVYILAALVDYFDNHKEYKRTQTGVEYGSLEISYESIQQDVRQAFDWLHREGQLKTRTLEDLDKYVAKEPKLPAMLDRLRQFGIIVFLATNSGYKYTDHLMRHALESPSSRRTWKTFFDYIFVDAQKPKFFQEGTTLREVDEATGSLKLGHIQPHKGLEKSKVYAGGSSELLAKPSFMLVTTSLETSSSPRSSRLCGPFW